MEGASAPIQLDDARRASPPPLAPPAIRVLCLLAIAGAAVWCGYVGRTHVRVGSPDFEYFYKAGAWLLAHGNLDAGYDVINGHVEQRDTLRWYLPFASRLMSVLVWLPQCLAGKGGVAPFRLTGYVWVAMNLAAMLGSLWLVGRYLTGLPPRDWAVTQLLPLAVLGVYWYWEFQLNQIDALTLLLLLGSFVCWEQGRRAVSGFWLGLAVLLKVTPGLVLLWFVLKRQHRTVAAAVLTIVLAGPAADLVVLRPAGATDAYRGWFGNVITTGSHHGLVAAQREMDWRNQGLGAVLSRWLHPTNYNTHFDNDPRVQEDYAVEGVRTLNVAHLPLATVSALTTLVLACSGLALIWLARQPARELTLWQLRFEWALFLLAMLWLMPVVRRYHMIWALPALSLLGAGAHYSGWSNRWSKLTLLCIGAVVALQFTMLSHRLEAMGALPASVALLALPLMVMLVRLKREPAALPQAHYAPPHPARSYGLTEPDAATPSAPLTTHA